MLQDVIPSVVAHRDIASPPLAVVPDFGIPFAAFGAGIVSSTVVFEPELEGLTDTG
jgi:hypothetical protein